MKVLLDENLAHRLRKNLGPHQVVTVAFKLGWIQEWRTVVTAEADGIEVVLFGDQAISYEQNLSTRAHQSHEVRYETAKYHDRQNAIHRYDPLFFREFG